MTKKNFIVIMFFFALTAFAKKAEYLCCENIPGHDKAMEISEAISQKATTYSLNLSLQHPKLTSAPETLAQLTYLRCLNLSFNRVSTFPANFKELQNLTCLDLSGNHHLQRLPDFFVEMPNLKIIKMKDLNWSATRRQETEARFPNITFKW